MKSNKVKSVFFLVMVCIFLTACIPNYVDKEYQKAIEAQGREKIEEYLDLKVSEGEMSDYELIRVYMQGADAQDIMGTFASPVVRGEFMTDNHEFIIDVNTENSDVYWNYYEKDVSEAMKESLSSDGANTDVVYGQLRTEYTIVGNNMENTYRDEPIDTYTRIYGVYPALGHSETKESIKEFLEDGENTYSLEIYFDAVATEVMKADFFEKLCENNPRITYIVAYNVSNYSYEHAEEYGYINDDFMMTTKEKYNYAPSGKSLDYYHYDVCEINGTCVNYVDYRSVDGATKNCRQPLAADEENNRVFYLNNTEDAAAYLFFKQTPKSDEADIYYYDSKKKKYKKLQHYDIIQYPSGVYSLYNEEDYNHGLAGFSFYSKYKMELKK